MAALSSYCYYDTLDLMNPSFNGSSFHERSEVADALLAFSDPPPFFIDDLFDPTPELVVDDCIVDPCELYLSCNDRDLYQSQPSDGLHVPYVGLVDQFPDFGAPQSTVVCNLENKGNAVSVPEVLPEFTVPPPKLSPPGFLNCGSPEFTVPPAIIGCNLENDTRNVPEFSPDFDVLPATLSPPAILGCGSPEYTVSQLPPEIGCITGQKTENENISPQSVAARERRKKISRKTQELGRLIPGGNRMNTAEMLQSAFKYVKFLQAQVGILGLINPSECCEISPYEQLQVLLSYPVVQEKLYGEAKCIVPKEMIVALAENCDIKASPFISRELQHFV